MASVASQLIKEVTTHAQNYSPEDAREICADGTYVPNNLRSFGPTFRYTSKFLKLKDQENTGTRTVRTESRGSSVWRKSPTEMWCGNILANHYENEI